MPYPAKCVQFQIAFKGMAYVETVTQYENIKYRQLLGCRAILNKKGCHYIAATFVLN